MRRMLAVLLALLIVAIPAHAQGAMGQITLQDSSQTHNALLAAQRIDQTILGPGQTFSFNEAVGPRTESNGFIPAINGRGTEVTGGGCAQTASALYLALKSLTPGTVSFDELSFYGDRYAGSYVSKGSQAVLVDYANGLDFRFTNLSGAELTISIGEFNGQLLCTVTQGEIIAEAAADARVAAPASAPSAYSIELNCGDDPATLANIALASESIHDTTLAPGDIFSFNAIVGPRETRWGYQPAPNGRGAMVIGGGVDQIASAIWLLIQDRPDISIVEKFTYGGTYNQSYVSRSADAIFTDYASGADFAFRYTGSTPLTLWVRPTANGCRAGWACSQ